MEIRIPPEYLEFITLHGAVESLVAVGKAVACLPPHRSVRAELPHTAPALGLDAKADYWIGMHRQLPGVRQESLGQHLHAFPRQPVPLTTPHQGMPPGADGLTAKGFHLPRI